MTTDRRRRGRALPRLAAVGVALLASAGCASDPPSPAEQRERNVRARLEASFSRAQVTCILDRLEADDLRALDSTGSLEADAAELRAFGDALAVCVADVELDASTTSTTAPG